MSILIAAMGAGQEGQAILEVCGFRGESDDWSGYQKWLGLRHQRRIWGENVSNSIAVLISIIIRIEGGRWIIEQMPWRILPYYDSTRSVWLNSESSSQAATGVVQCAGKRCLVL